MQLSSAPMDLLDCSQPSWWALAAALNGAIAYFALRRILSWLRMRALAHPNSRSSHSLPTPQGAGIVIVPLAIVVAALPFSLNICTPTLGFGGMHAFVAFVAILCLTTVGFLDDQRPLPIALRLIVQIIAVMSVIFTLPGEYGLLPSLLPRLAERVLIVAAVLWFINLTNFMDGADLMSATETAAITVGIAILAAMGAVPPNFGWIAAALFGTMLGFVPWNAPPARVFLGDAGSVPIGLMIALLLLHIAASGHVISALILPLYYLADASVTMTRRLVVGDRFWEAHRDHYYQRALRRGMPVPQLIVYVGLTNAGLVALSTLAGVAEDGAIQFGALLAAILLVAWTLSFLSRGGALRHA